MTERSEGFTPFPNFYADRKRTMEYGNENPDGSYIWTTDRLEAVVWEYAEFLQRERIMPRADLTANEIINRAMFELAWRDGMYDQPNEDELCEGGTE